MNLELSSSPSVEDELRRRDDLAERLRWLARLRWVTLCGILALVFVARGLEAIASTWPLIVVCAAMALINLGFTGLHRQYPGRTLRALLTEAFLQITADMCGLGSLILFFGGHSNYFSAFSATLLAGAYAATAIIGWRRAQSRVQQRLKADLAESAAQLAEAERKLAAEAQRTRAILDGIDDGVVVVDPHGKVLLANSAAQRNALPGLAETLKQSGCHERSALEPLYCHGPLSGEDLLNHHHQHPPQKNENVSKPQSAVAFAKDSCPMGNPVACLQEALERGGWLCPATLALLGADPPAPEAPLLTPPSAPRLARIESKGRVFENTVSALRAEDGRMLGLMIVSREIGIGVKL